MSDAGKGGRDVVLRDLLDRLGEKWTERTLTLLHERPRRFNELRRDMDGISQRMLTRTLRGLERDGFLERTVYPTVPPSVSYALTDLGESFYDSLLALRVWVHEHREEIRVARSVFDATHQDSASASPFKATGSDLLARKPTF